MHYATSMDLRALGRRPTPYDLQELRLERRLRRRTPLLAYSARVAAWSHATELPVALAMPASPLPLIDQPVAVLLADWTWEPNRRALAALLGAWTAVHDAIPAARLELAGRGDARVGSLAGVTDLGSVASSTEVLSRAAVFAFPCPDTSGPKIKVLEAVAAGVPVLTTAAGVEGLRTDAVTTVTVDRFALGLIALLRSAERRAELAQRARSEVALAHAPRPAARARLAALERHQHRKQQRPQPR
jgi:glycosyltransferase involved in cell wall biosynthesis